jgi:nucleoside-diphosphate-sugar epimerase
MEFSLHVREALLSGGRVIVTGAGGWLGQATLEMLSELFGNTMSDRVVAFGTSSRSVTLRTGARVQLTPLPEIVNLSSEIETLCIAHFAFLTREKTSSLSLEQYRQANSEITNLVAKQAVRLSAKGVFVTSSGAVYRADGRLEMDEAANPYGFLKLQEEEAFARACKSASIHFARCRVFNLSGPYINKSYLLRDLITDALEGRALTLLAQRPVYRSYAAVRDVVDIGFGIALGLVALDDVAYDTAGSESIEVGDLGIRVLSVLTSGKGKILRQPLNSDLEDRYVGMPWHFLRAAEKLGFEPQSLERQISETAVYILSKYLNIDFQNFQ